MSRDYDSKKKKGFWKSLFAKKSPAAPKNGTLTDVEDNDDTPSPRPHPQRRGSNPELVRSNGSKYFGNSSTPLVHQESRKLHKRNHSEPAVTPLPAKGKGRESPHSQHARFASLDPTDDRTLTEWPPAGYNSDDELRLGDAMELICKGVPIHKGFKRPVPHAREVYYSTYATTAGNRGDETDGVNQHDSMTQLMTMRMMGPGPATHPWETMEQPSFSFYFGQRPGTVTLNRWASTASVLPPPLTLRDSGIIPKQVGLQRIFARLKDLEGGLEDDDPEYMYKNLYRRFLIDPDSPRAPHKTLDKQITDLILVLSRPDHWIDFSQPKNNIVTRFIFDTDSVNHDQYHKFFHQLLLSMELDLRIRSRQHVDGAKEQLLEQLPAPIRWNLALSRRWRENVRIEAYGSTADQVKLRYKLKRRQVKMIKRFAQMMKWPNLRETLDALRQGDKASSLDEISSHAMAFFSGLVLPGPSFPFVIMNALIDIDPDEATDDLALLIHLNPSCGFQYRNGYTYWTSMSIVGKVLAPTCHEVAGWVGPCRPTSDLKRSQIARIRSRRPKQRLRIEDVTMMTECSDPLGPPTEVFPVKEYELTAPDVDDYVDTVRIELLTLLPCVEKQADPGPKWFDAALQFAIDGASWPLRLTYDVQFVSAWPCSQGPHPLFFDYTYQVVKADEIIEIRDWAGLYGQKNMSQNGIRFVGSASSNHLNHHNHHHDDETDSSGSGEGSSKAAARRATTPNGHGNGNGFIDDDYDRDKVLVVEAFGVPDNEVLARAWCAHWGLSAVVADISKTCMACAIRETYAAALNVVILIDDDQHAYYDE